MPPPSPSPARIEYTRTLFAQLLEGRTQVQLGLLLGVPQSRISTAVTVGRIGAKHLCDAAELAGRPKNEVLEILAGDLKKRTTPVYSAAHLPAAADLELSMRKERAALRKVTELARILPGPQAPLVVLALQSWNVDLSSVDMDLIQFCGLELEAARRHVLNFAQVEELRAEKRELLERVVALDNDGEDENV